MCKRGLEDVCEGQHSIASRFPGSTMLDYSFLTGITIKPSLSSWLVWVIRSTSLRWLNCADKAASTTSMDKDGHFRSRSDHYFSRDCWEKRSSAPQTTRELVIPVNPWVSSSAHDHLSLGSGVVYTKPETVLSTCSKRIKMSRNKNVQARPTNSCQRNQYWIDSSNLPQYAVNGSTSEQIYTA